MKTLANRLWLLFTIFAIAEPALFLVNMFPYYLNNLEVVETFILLALPFGGIIIIFESIIARSIIYRVLKDPNQYAKRNVNPLFRLILVFIIGNVLGPLSVGIFTYLNGMNLNAFDVFFIFELTLTLMALFMVLITLTFIRQTRDQDEQFAQLFNPKFSFRMAGTIICFILFFFGEFMIYYNFQMYQSTNQYLDSNIKDTLEEIALKMDSRTEAIHTLLHKRMTLFPQLVKAEEYQWLDQLLINDIRVNPYILNSYLGYAPNQGRDGAYFDIQLWVRENDGINTLSIDYEKEYNYFDRSNNIMQWYNQHVGQNEAIIRVTDPYLDVGANNKLMVSVSAPIFVEGNFIGVSGLDIDIESIKKMIDNPEKIPSAFLFLIDSSGNCIYHPDESLIFTQNFNQLTDTSVRSGYQSLMKSISKSVGSVNESELNAVIVENGIKYRTQLQDLQFSDWKMVFSVPTAYYTTHIEVNSLINFLLFAGAFILALLFSLYFSRTIEKIFKRLNINLLDSSAQIETGSRQISSSSSKLAASASEQASSLEESAAAIKELEGQTLENTDKTKDANQLVDQSAVIIDKADISMQTLRSNMEKIANSSSETSKIIKVIDEIAFQTNLLALNAAVEAARAGEAGMGFAVVADEVRKLAHRSAEAAKSTSELIEGSLKQISGGVELTEDTTATFSEVVTYINKLKSIVNDVNISSQEQSNGIAELSRTITDLENVTQDNAAHSEESASASEQMYAQSQTLMKIVNELAMVIGSYHQMEKHAEADNRQLPTSDRDTNRKMIEKQAGHQFYDFDSSE